MLIGSLISGALLTSTIIVKEPLTHQPSFLFLLFVFLGNFICFRLLYRIRKKFSIQTEMYHYKLEYFL